MDTFFVPISQSLAQYIYKSFIYLREFMYQILYFLGNSFVGNNPKLYFYLYQIGKKLLYKYFKNGLDIYFIERNCYPIFHQIIALKDLLKAEVLEIENDVILLPFNRKQQQKRCYGSF